MRPSGLTEVEMKVLLVFSNLSPNTNKQLREGSGLKHTSLGRVMDRLVVFDLVSEHQVKRADNRGKETAYALTKSGKATLEQYFAQKKSVEPALEATEKAVEARSTLSAEIRSQSDKQPNLVPWLRDMAASFLAMADKLEQA